MNTFQILTSKFWFDLMHWNVSIGPEKWPIFGRFLTLFPFKHPVRRKKIPPTWRRPSVMSLMTSRASPLYVYNPVISYRVSTYRWTPSGILNSSSPISLSSDLIVRHLYFQNPAMFDTEGNEKLTFSEKKKYFEKEIQEQQNEKPRDGGKVAMAT
jgi:hypothetical protein